MPLRWRSKATRALPVRAFAEMGHWLMLESPQRFYAAVEEDLRRLGS
jgi:pimeloyl-ACP methyl ester carboxylesterase